MDVASGEPGRWLICGGLAAAQLNPRDKPEGMPSRTSSEGKQEDDMSRTKMSVDQKVYDLAVLFLSEVDGATKDDTEVLAQDIQWTIEDFIKYEIPERHAEKAGA